MARHKNKKKTPKTRKPLPEVLTPHLLWHLRCLKLATAEDYLAWCREEGHDARLGKTEPVLRREREAWQRRTAIAALQRSRYSNDPAGVLARLCCGAIDLPDVPLRLQPVAQDIPSLPEWQRETLAELFLLLGDRSRFLLATRRFGARSYAYTDAVIGLAARRAAWIRDPGAWRPRTHNRTRQFTSFVEHLVARYPVPAVLQAAWFRRDAEAARMRDWYVHVARGQNLRTADTPIPVTKRVAHYLGDAPSTLSIEAALRWCQVRALGGSAPLADAFAATPVAASFEHDAFWQSVMRFLVRQPDLDPAEVGPIIDYIRCQKFEPVEAVLPDGRVVERPPPRPGFAMRDRVLRALRAEVDRWHRMLAHTAGPDQVWRATGIRGYEESRGTVAKGNRRCWRIEELRSRKALMHEGHALGHCVAAYATWCARGRSSIWSLTLEQGGTIRRMQTIEINQHKTIIQSRGKNNGPPTEAIRAVIRRWAAREGLHPGVVL